MIKISMRILLLLLLILVRVHGFSQINDTANVVIDSSNNVTSNQFPKISYQWISYQIKAKIIQADEDPTNLQIFFVNRIDSIIYLNFNKMGIELLRMVLTPDEIIYVNKLDETYYQGPYDRFRLFLINIPFDFYFIQAILNGVDFPNFEPDLVLMEEDSLLHYSANKRKNSKYELAIMQDVFLNKDSTLYSNEITDLATLNSIEILYSDYNSIDSITFFQKMKFIVEDEDVEFEGVLKNIKINVPGPTSIRIPKKFRSLTAD